MDICDYGNLSPGIVETNVLNAPFYSHHSMRVFSSLFSDLKVIQVVVACGWYSS